MVFKNQNKIKKSALSSLTFMGIAGLVVTALIVTMTYWKFDVDCQKLQRKNREMQASIVEAKNKLNNMQTRWDRENDVVKIKELLARSGLAALDYPNKNQIVKVSSKGVPHPGQVAVKELKKQRKLAKLSTDANEGVLKKYSPKKANKRLAKKGV